jgi:hypothetical protein
MMWVRLIGGVRSGQVIKVDDDQQEVRVSERIPMPASPRLSLASISATVSFSVYTRREVRTPRGDIFYFAEASLSDFAALQSVLGP